MSTREMGPHGDARSGRITCDVDSTPTMKPQDDLLPSQPGCASFWRRQMQYFDSWLIAESLVSITSGVWVWVGCWGIWDVYIFRGIQEDCSFYAPDDVPSSRAWQGLAHLNGAAYVALVLFTIVLMLLTRTLYSKEELRSQRARVRDGALSYMLPGLRRASAMTPGNSVRGSEVSWVGASPSHGVNEGGRALPEHEERYPTPDGRGGAEPDERPRPQARPYSERPPWSWSKASQAILGIMIDCAFWVGTYNLTDYIFIPWVVSAWRGEVNLHCTPSQHAVGIATRLGLIIVGCAGLFVTGSLYGHETVQAANFERLS